MPPIKKYIYKYRMSSCYVMTIETFGDESQSLNILSNLVKNVDEWILSSVK